MCLPSFIKCAVSNQKEDPVNITNTGTVTGILFQRTAASWMKVHLKLICVLFYRRSVAVSSYVDHLTVALQVQAKTKSFASLYKTVGILKTE